MRHSSPSRLGIGRSAFTAHNAALIALLIVVALLLRSDTVMPVHVRVPGLLILAALLVWLVVESLRKQAGRRG